MLIHSTICNFTAIAFYDIKTQETPVNFSVSNFSVDNLLIFKENEKNGDEDNQCHA
jgi:hypothetical protein